MQQYAPKTPHKTALLSFVALSVPSCENKATTIEPPPPTTTPTITQREAADSSPFIAAKLNSTSSPSSTLTVPLPNTASPPAKQDVGKPKESISPKDDLTAEQLEKAKIKRWMLYLLGGSVATLASMYGARFGGTFLSYKRALKASNAKKHREPSTGKTLCSPELAPMPNDSITAPAQHRGYDYEISGGSRPIVSFQLKPGERVIAESGSMLGYDTRISMQIVARSALNTISTGRGFLKRWLLGESLFVQEFENTSNEPAQLAISPSRVGQMISIDLSKFQKGLSAIGGAFFAATPGVTLDVLRRKSVKGLMQSTLSGLGLFQQQLSGTGELFLFSRGALLETNLTAGQTMFVDADALFMWESGLDLQFERLPLLNAATGGEGLYVCRITGPGTFWVSSRGRADDKSQNNNGGATRLVGTLADYVAP